MTEATVVSSVSADLLGREAEHLAQDQHGALGRRQVLEGDDEGQLDALALLVAGVRGGEPVLDAELLVRVGLDPDRLDQRLARAARGDRPRARSPRAAPASAGARDRVEAGVGGDLVEPGANRAAALELRQAAPGPQLRLLERVLGVVDRAEHAVAVRVQLASDVHRPADRRRTRRPLAPPRASSRSAAAALAEAWLMPGGRDGWSAARRSRSARRRSRGRCRCPRPTRFPPSGRARPSPGSRSG